MMLLKMGEDGVLSQVDEDDLVYVSEKELEDLIKENEQLKKLLLRFYTEDEIEAELI